MLFTYTENGEFKQLETDVFLDSFKNSGLKLAFYEGADGESTVHNEELYLEYIKPKV